MKLKYAERNNISVEQISPDALVILEARAKRICRKDKHKSGEMEQESDYRDDSFPTFG